MCTKYWQSAKIKVLFELMLKVPTAEVMSRRCLHFMGLLQNMKMTYKCLHLSHERFIRMDALT